MIFELHDRRVVNRRDDPQLFESGVTASFRGGRTAQDLDRDHVAGDLHIAGAIHVGEASGADVLLELVAFAQDHPERNARPFLHFPNGAAALFVELLQREGLEERAREVVRATSEAGARALVRLREARDDRVLGFAQDERQLVDAELPRVTELEQLAILLVRVLPDTGDARAIRVLGAPGAEPGERRVR